MKKYFKNTILLLAFMLILGACSKNEQETEASEPKEIEQQEEEEAKEEEDLLDEEDVDEPEEEVEMDNSDISSLLEEIEMITEGEVELMYESKEPQVHVEEEYKLSLDHYAVIHIKDFHSRFSIPFDEKDEGVIVLSHYTLKNTSDDAIAYTPNFSFEYSGAQRYAGPNRDLIPESVQLNEHLNTDNNFVIEANEEISGYVAMNLHIDEIDQIEEVGYAEIHAPEAGDEYEPDEYSYKNKIGQPAAFKIFVSGDSEDAQQSQEGFYPDKTTKDNMGKKIMIKEKTDIGETKSLRDSKITLEGYQFTEFEPNENEAPRFENFDTGIVLLNIKLYIENNEEEELDLLGQKAKLTVNDGKQYILYTLMLSHYTNHDGIAPGETDEAYVIFALDKEQYEKIWKDKAFEFEYGPLYGVESGDLSKGKSVEFILPE